MLEALTFGCGLRASAVGASNDEKDAVIETDTEMRVVNVLFSFIFLLDLPAIYLGRLPWLSINSA